MKKTVIILLFAGILIAVFFILTQREKIEVVEEKVGEVEEEGKLKDIVEGFLGAPYERGPLGEKENEEIYREDVFDCTTLVLVSVSKLFSNGFSPEEMIKRVNYFPEGDVSYENRLHFSTYRNSVISIFEDITREVAPDLYKEKEITLNKKRDGEGRLIDIEWEERIVVPYIEIGDVFEIIPVLPDEVGVAFLIDGDEEIGLDIRHEGFLFEGEYFVHASLEKGEVFKESFSEFLERSEYDSVNFFKINY